MKGAYLWLCPEKQRKKKEFGRIKVKIFEKGRNKKVMGYK